MAVEYCGKYVGQHAMEHCDFEVACAEYSVFYKAKFSWGDDGYAIVNQGLARDPCNLDCALFLSLHSLQTLVVEGLAPLLDAVSVLHHLSSCFLC
jgi:hypothetical protein